MLCVHVFVHDEMVHYIRHTGALERLGKESVQLTLTNGAHSDHYVTEILISLGGNLGWLGGLRSFFHVYFRGSLVSPLMEKSL